MSSIISQFRTRAEQESEANLAEFIRYCRHDLTWLGDDPAFDWELPEWPGVRWVKVTVGKRQIFDESEQLDPEFLEFAKAYYRYKNSHSPTVSREERFALKVLEAALLDLTKSGSIRGFSLQVLDEAAVLTRRHYIAASQYHIGRHLMKIASFVSQRKLIPVDVSSWKSPFRRPSSVRRTGLAGRQEIDRKMPSQTALDAMAEIFANDPDETRARFASAVWALLMSAPWRISEVLNLHVDAEYEGLDDQGVPSYGFRYYGAKAFQHDIKWVSKTMEPVAREAFRRLRDMTQSARELAAHLELTPEVPFRYDDCPAVGFHDELSLDDKAAYLRLPRPNRPVKKSSLWQFRSIAEHWERARRRIPRDFPYFNKTTRLKWSEALFCMHPRMLHPTNSTDCYRLWGPTSDTFNSLICTSPHGNKKGIFGSLGYTEPDGSPIKLTTHQARHYLSTLAERGGMAQEDLAKWAGRADMKDNRVYNHMTEAEKVAQARALTQEVQLFGAHQRVQMKAPVTMQDFNLREPGPVHKTEFGYCLHDWPMSPCDKYRDCLNCLEHVYVKGNPECHARIKEKVAFLQSQYDEVMEAINQGEAGADRWLEHVSKTLFPAKELLELLESDEIEDGTVIRRNPDAVREHSHLGRALDQKLPQPPDNSLAQTFQLLLNERH